MSRRVKIDYTTILSLFPEANRIPYLPRKKKKALKKKISRLVVDLIKERIEEDEKISRV